PSDRRDDARPSIPRKSRPAGRSFTFPIGVRRKELSFRQVCRISLKDKMSPESLVLIAVALGAGAIVKGATGMGLPLIAVPALAASFGVPHALAIMTVPILVTNIWQIWRYRAHIRGI